MKSFGCLLITFAALCGVSSSSKVYETLSAVSEEQDLSLVQEAKCHFYRTKEKCILNACYWCKSAAVPSSCYTKDEASQLPPAVFQCDKEHTDSSSSGFLLRTEPVEEEEEEVQVQVLEEEATEATAAKCHFYRTKEKCVLNACYWCKSAAVPSSCYTKDEASQLPPAVFQCDKEDVWELTKIPEDPVEIQRLFQKWKHIHQKKYTSSFEEQVRFNIFMTNAQLIVSHNTNPSREAYTLELNEFADMTWEEFQQWYLATPQNCSATHTASSSSSALTASMMVQKPGEKDWRQDGMVSPVKNQGKCGSCWTFSTTGCLESHHKIKHGGPFVSLSEQNLLDCALAFDNHGCNGGLPSHAFEYIMYNGGIDTEESYPYHAKEETCHYQAQTIGAQVHQVVNITSRDESELMGAVGVVGPVSIAFQVVSDFRFYKEGVYTSKECHHGEQDVNHAVLAVGYGIDKATKKKYWIVKNSWGTKWGMEGFFEIEKDVNMCGLADCASYPLIV